jgi:hypothetical protein
MPRDGGEEEGGGRVVGKNVGGRRSLMGLNGLIYIVGCLIHLPEIAV